MKIAICGLWHVHAEQYYKAAAENAEVVGVYEPNETWRKNFCEKYNLHGFESFGELLASDADSVIVCTPTDAHAEVIVKLAEAGKNIFTEKVLAFTSADCEKIADAVNKNEVEFVISLPHKYGAAQRTAKAIADSGELGKINYFRYRNVHSGSSRDWLPAHFYNAKECGGGAMIDLGAHGMYLSEWFCGMPVSASSTFTLAAENSGAAEKNTDRVEDNAVTVMKYENGCIGVNETGFVSVGCPIILEVGGEKGYVRCSPGKLVKNTESTGSKEEETELLAALPTPIEQFCTGKILPGCGIEEAKKLTALMELAYGNVQ